MDRKTDMQTQDRDCGKEIGRQRERSIQKGVLPRQRTDREVVRETGWEPPGLWPPAHDQAGGHLDAIPGQGPSLSPTLLLMPRASGLARAGPKFTEISETSSCSVCKGPAKGHLYIVHL